MIVLNDKEINRLPNEDKKQYYQYLKEYCISLKSNPNIGMGQKLISKLCPMLRNYDLDIRGTENLLIDNSYSKIIMCNHSNSHDFFTACETFSKLDLPVSVFAADDDLNFISTNAFKFANATLVDRKSKESCQNGLLELTGKLLNGNYAVIFGESTWNLHPERRMQTLKVGAAKSAAISEKYIIPTIFEYVEIPEIFKKEKDLYRKCIVQFGKPIQINSEKDLYEQTLEIENTMIKMREKLWDEIGILEGNKKQVNPNIYVNHMWLRKFGGLGFEYDSESEFNYLYFKPNIEKENEYHFTEDNSFVPGITKKEEKEKALSLHK